VLIATKAGLAWRDGAVFRDSRPARIREEIEASLRRLRTDVIDIYQVHWPHLEAPIAETARTLKDLRREGKIRAIGVSNYSPPQMDAFRAAARLDTVQPPYNLFEREIEADVLPYARSAGQRARYRGISNPAAPASQSVFQRVPSGLRPNAADRRG
jgi:aryl-alcohol dehydrogenase-like predicted oxidoreductase